MEIGVLALQGDVLEHINTLKSINVCSREVRLPEDLKGLEGLIIPGGESTTISLLLKKNFLTEKIKKMQKSGLAIFGNCAGAILLAKKVFGEKKVKSLGLIDISIERNAYGRQVNSFETTLSLNGDKKSFKASFIRAPLISKIGKNVKVLCEFQKRAVLVSQNNCLASTFHTELDNTTVIHELFLKQIKK